MRFQIFQILFLSHSCLIGAQHFQSPEETDVESPNFCETNSDGFGGRPITDEESTVNSYFYELTFSGIDSNSAIQSVEEKIGSYLLAESSLFEGCRRRSLVVHSKGLRRLQGGGATAITTLPQDFPYDDLSCSSSSTLAEDQTCIVVEGGYRVYYPRGFADPVNRIMIPANAQVEAGMADGVFLGDGIDAITWVDSLQPSTSGANEAGTATVRSVGGDDGNATPIIIGASVGGVLVLGLLVFYRRQSIKQHDDETNFTPGGSTMMS